MSTRWSVVLALFLWPNPYIWTQDCNDFNLTASPDTVICTPNSPVDLLATFTGVASNIQWLPEAGLNESNILNPTATVSTTTTYEVTIQAVSPENLIFNGDFSLGDTGFSTDYDYGDGGSFGLLSDEGEYAIAGSPNDTHSNFADCPDHTGGGNMMVVNGSGQPDDVWCQTVNVTPNTMYSFGTWVMTAISENPAELQFSINGVLLGNQFDADIQTCLWQEFAEPWFSGGNSSAQICIVNVNEQEDGNDFAIDDITFSPICTYTASVTIEVADPPAAPQVTCLNATTDSLWISWPSVPGADGYTVDVLDGPVGIFLSDTTYLVTGLNPEQTVNFEVTAFDENCSTTSSLGCTTLACPSVQVELLTPNAVCLGDSLGFSIAIISDANGPFTLEIIDDQGTQTYSNIPTGETEFVIAPPSSTFDLIIGSLTVEGLPACTYSLLPPPVTINVTPPPSPGTAAPFVACAGSDGLIDLADQLIGADAGGTWADTGSPSPLGGAFDASSNTVDLAQLDAGLYTLSYTLAGTGGCQDTSTLLSIEALLPPDVDAGPDVTLDCTNIEAILGTNSPSADIAYQWQVLEGVDLLSGAEEPQAVTNGSGVYLLTATNELDGCSAQDTVVSTEQITNPNPVASLLPVQCGQNSVAISVDSVLDGTPPYEYSLEGGTLTSDPVFSNLGQGTYTVMVVDGNGCEGATLVTIPEVLPLDVEIVSPQGSDGFRLFAGDSLRLEALVNFPMDEVSQIVWIPAAVDCPDCISVSYAPQFSTTYQVIVTDVNGCTDTDEFSVAVEQLSRYYFPTAFSPNEDGRNDIFYPYTGPEFKGIASLVIADRWGNIVFRAEDFAANQPSSGWDGRINGTLAATGVYAYVATLIYQNDTELTVSGEINLLR